MRGKMVDQSLKMRRNDGRRGMNGKDADVLRAMILGEHAAQGSLPQLVCDIPERAQGDAAAADGQFPHDLAGVGVDVAFSAMQDGPIRSAQLPWQLSFRRQQPVAGKARADPRSDANGDVVSPVQHIDILIGEVDRELDLGMSRQEIGQARQDVQCAHRM